jgi:hypothetical protein
MFGENPICDMDANALYAFCTNGKTNCLDLESQSLPNARIGTMSLVTTEQSGRYSRDRDWRKE